MKSIKPDVLVPKGNGTYFPPVRVDEKGFGYVPAEYKNIDKWCICRKSSKKYCQDFTLHHKVHICSNCGGILSKHIML
jgi:hypothetical protein